MPASVYQLRAIHLAFHHDQLDIRMIYFVACRARLVNLGTRCPWLLGVGNCASGCPRFSEPTTKKATSSCIFLLESING